MEFFKLHISDIDRFYYGDDKVLCVRIEYNNTHFYVIYFLKHCCGKICITSNSHLFMKYVTPLIGDKKQIDLIYKTLYEGEQLSSLIINDDGIVVKKKKMNTNVGICKDLVQYKYHFKKLSFQSRVYNQFVDEFVVDTSLYS